MRPSPAHRLRFFAGASTLTTALLFVFSGSPVASADTIPEMLGPPIRFVRLLSQELKNLEATVAGFADSFTTKELTFNRATGNELCLSDANGTSCYTRSQLDAAVASAGTASSGQESGAAASLDASIASSSGPPVIQINGNNPDYIQVGETYNDLGATITGPQADLNLGIQTYLNGALVSIVVLDTSAATTDTIDYVATDQNGLTATSTRTVVIQPATGAGETASSTATQTIDSTSTEATSTVNIAF